MQQEDSLTICHAIESIGNAPNCAAFLSNFIRNKLGDLVLKCKHPLSNAVSGLLQNVRKMFDKDWKHS